MTGIFDNVISTQTTAITQTAFFECLICSVILGIVIALIHNFKNKASRSFTITLVVLPPIVQMVIMLVNGSIGAGIAVMGAFNLVRFRSAPGNAREIACVFLAMAVGLATGMGYLGFAVLFVVVIGLMMIVFNLLGFDGKGSDMRELRITTPESLEYDDAFEDLFEKYLKSSELVEVKTSNMGSLYKLKYHIFFKDQKTEKKFIDDLRCRNGNLEISCGRAEFSRDIL